MIKDADHAVRFLKAIVKEKSSDESPHVKALVAGAKAVLSRWEVISEKHQKYFDDGGDKLLGEFWAGRKEEADGFIVINAQAYAGELVPAGMKMPK